MAAATDLKSVGRYSRVSSHLIAPTMLLWIADLLMTTGEDKVGKPTKVSLEKLPNMDTKYSGEISTEFGEVGSIPTVSN